MSAFNFQFALKILASFVLMSLLLFSQIKSGNDFGEAEIIFAEMDFLLLKSRFEEVLQLPKQISLKNTTPILVYQLITSLCKFSN